MVRTSIAALVGSVAAVLAVNTPPAVPENAQIGKLAFPVSLLQL
jgi:hypothetical protein